MLIIYLLASLLFLIIPQTFATTEWFGDLRAQLNPPRSPPFYDVTYDDTDCPQGLQSNAIPDFVYFGAMIATLTVQEHTECLQHCNLEPKCHAVNFFEPMSYQEKGFCELLSETQFDNPRLMRPFRRAVYYEKIRCRRDEDEGADTVITKPAAAEERIPKDLNNQLNSRVPAARELAKMNSSGNEIKKPNASMAAMMKRLEAKVHEFNLRFRSRR
uniref:Apple domain-containing protein n=1 Tax=Panagrolaimus superbus TaxID=310955 RepID=A0A914YZ29_9BILA